VFDDFHRSYRSFSVLIPILGPYPRKDARGKVKYE